MPHPSDAAELRGCEKLLNQVMNAEGVVMVTSWLDPSRIVGEGNRVETAGYGN